MYWSLWSKGVDAGPMHSRQKKLFRKQITFCSRWAIAAARGRAGSPYAMQVTPYSRSRTANARGRAGSLYISEAGDELSLIGKMKCCWESRR